MYLHTDVHIYTHIPAHTRVYNTHTHVYTPHPKHPPIPTHLQLYVIGGNGGNAAANAIYKQCEADGILCSVIGVPKSIDNDIQLLDKYV